MWSTKNKIGAVYLREKCLKKRHCWTNDDVTWTAQLTQPYQRP